MPPKPYSSGEVFIEALEKSQDEGNFDHVELNVLKLRELIEQKQDDAYRLARIQHRARSVLLRNG